MGKCVHVLGQSVALGDIIHYRMQGNLSNSLRCFDREALFKRRTIVTPGGYIRVNAE